MPSLRETLVLFKLPSHADFRDGYFLRRRTFDNETPCPAYGAGKVFLNDWDVVRENTRAYQARTGRRFANELTPYGKANDAQPPRWSLRVTLRGKDGELRERPLAWLLAVALKKAEEDAWARKVAPHYVDPKNWGLYEGDHWPFADQCDCRLANIRPLHRDRHRSDERFGWERKSLPPQQRGLKRPAAALRQAAAKARAKAKAKAKPKAKAKAKTRPWQR